MLMSATYGDIQCKRKGRRYFDERKKASKHLENTEKKVARRGGRGEARETTSKDYIYKSTLIFDWGERYPNILIAPTLRGLVFFSFFGEIFLFELHKQSQSQSESLFWTGKLGSGRVEWSTLTTCVISFVLEVICIFNFILSTTL